ncbi:glycosyltransferase family 2 protein [Acidobacteriota bacterium]
MKTGKTDVSIIIPARNEADNIAACLKAILNQETDLSVEIILIDSGSTDDTGEIVKQFPAVKLITIKPEEFGHGKTRNLGAGHSKGDYIVFLNADAIPADKNWLHPLIGNLHDDKKKATAGVYSRHVPKKGCHLYMARDILKSMPEHRFVTDRSKYFDFMIFSTVSCAVRREIWQRFPFAERIVIAEDQDWAKRVLDEGFKIVYEPGSQVYHSHNYSLNELFAIKRRIGGTERKFKNRFCAATVGFLLIVGRIVIKTAGDILFILFRRKRRSEGEYTEGMTPLQKLKQIPIAVAARVVSFAGRYRGWTGGKYE